MDSISIQTGLAIVFGFLIAVLIIASISIFLGEEKNDWDRHNADGIDN